MFLNLPLEIILNVTSNLSFHDKLNLMTACKRLKTLISELSLYEWLQIQDRNTTESVIARFKDKEFNGLQVKRLELWFDVLSSQLYRQLPVIFPNVTQLRNYSDTEGVRDDYTVKKMLKWKDTLECYDTRHNLFKIGRLIENNAFSRLNHLCLSPYFILDWRMHKTDLKIFECISHAPLLKVLELYLCEINMEFFEKVHDICPYLHTLSLEKVLVAIRNDNNSLQSIIPASNFLRLQISRDSIICDKNNVFLNYIIKKYPNLQNLEFLSALLEDDLGELLNTFHDNDSDAHEDNDTVADTLEDDLNQTIINYWEKGFEFLKSLPKSLKTLKVYSNIFSRMIDGLEKAELNLSVLKFEDLDIGASCYAMLGDSKDAHYVSSQRSLKTLKIKIDPKITDTFTDILSSSITELYLLVLYTESINTMSLDWILSKFPSLEKLNIFAPNGLIMEKSLNVPHYNLRELKIVQDLTDSECLKNISLLAPNIKRLSYDFPNLGVSPTEQQCSVQNLEKMFSPTDLNFSHSIDISGFDLDSFRLKYDSEKLKIKYNVEKDIFTGGSGIDFEIRIKKKIKKFHIPNCQNHITVREGRDNVHRGDLVRIQVLCNEIKELIIGGTDVMKYKGGNIFLQL